MPPVKGKIIKVPYNGQMVDAEEVIVDETLQRWSEVRLSDGTMVRITMSVISAHRLVGIYDDSGNPQYFINATPTLAIGDVPTSLKKK